MDWRRRIIISKLSEGCTLREAVAAAGVSRISAWNWSQRSAEFAQAVAQAREAGQAERTYRLWLRHPFRGKRPPAGKGHGGKPRFTYGRRG